jgi:hypothetical protein
MGTAAGVRDSPVWRLPAAEAQAARKEGPVVELLEAELARENARSTLAVIHRHGAEVLSVGAVEVLIRIATRLAEDVLVWGHKGLSFFDKGLEGRDARVLLDVSLAAFEACRELAAVVENEASRVEGRTGHAFSGLSDLADRARQVAGVEKSARSLHELANRPVKPIDPALLGRGAAAYEKGETVDLKEEVVRRKAGQAS